MHEQIKRYFKPFPRWAVWMIGIGVLLAVKGVGLLMIGVGIWGLVDWNRKPSDAQMDAWIDRAIEALHPRALVKTGTDRSQLVAEPVTLTGPALDDRAGTQPMLKKGKDNLIRFTPIHVTIINFAEHQLIVYGCVLDLTTGNALNETSDEYFYRDVVSVSTKTKSLTVRHRGEIRQLNAAEIFQLTTSGGTSVEALLRSDELFEMMGCQGEIPTTRSEKAIQAIRAMLRAKKADKKSEQKSEPWSAFMA